MGKPDAAHLIAELARHGVTSYRIDSGGKHPRLVFEWQGRERFYVFPGSPGDNRRGDLNGVSALRRVMGVDRVPQSKSDRPKRQRAKDGPSAVPVLATFERADPLAALAAWRPPSRFVWRRAGPREWRVMAREAAGG